MGLAGGKGGVSSDAFAKLTSIKQKHNKNLSPKILFAIPHLVFKIHRR